jgi:sugar lactone lactonase YvrE
VTTKPELLLERDANTGEGPVVDGDLLHWVDIPAGLIHRTNVKSLKTESIDLAVSIGAAVPTESSDAYAVAYADGFGIVDNKKIQPENPFLADPNYRMNDAKCDARGRLWGGSCHLEFVSGGGKLHRWDGGNSNRVLVENLTLPNGLGWNKENSRMYLVDSITKKLFVSDFDLADDFIPKFRELISIDSGLPDGLAIDNEGCIWLAVWGGSRVSRISPEGKIVSEHYFPVSQPSSCAFDLDGTLYVTSARKGLTESDLVQQPLAGSIFTLSTNTSGVPVSKFKEIK